MKERGMFNFFIIMAVLFFVAISFVGGAQDLCGDGTCQEDLEDDLSCPRDCVDVIEEGILEGQEGYVTFDSGIILDDSFISDSGLEEERVGANKQINDIPFTSSLTFKVILIIIILIVVSLIGFFAYYKMKDDDDARDSKFSEVPSENSVQLN